MKKSAVLLAVFLVLAGGCARRPVRQTKGAVNISYPKTATADTAYILVERRVQKNRATDFFELNDLTEVKRVATGTNFATGPDLSSIKGTVLIKERHLLSNLFFDETPWGRTGEHKFEMTVSGLDHKPVKFENIVINLQPSQLLCRAVTRPARLKVCYPARAIPSEAFLEIHPSAAIATWDIIDKQSGVLNSLGPGLLTTGGFPPAELKRLEKLATLPFKLELVRLFPVTGLAFSARDKIDLEIQVGYEGGGRASIDDISIRMR